MNAGNTDDAYLGDMQIVARCLDAVEAQLLCACLRAGGVPADTGDTQLVQTDSLIAIALGGACVRVPAQCVADAQELIAAFHRGDLALDDDFDGLPPPG